MNISVNNRGIINWLGGSASILLEELHQYAWVSEKCLLHPGEVYHDSHETCVSVCGPVVNTDFLLNHFLVFPSQIVEMFPYLGQLSRLGLI